MPRRSILRRIIGRLSYANVMATLALFVALGGGAYAVSIEKNSVGSKQIADGEVRSVDVQNESLRSADFDVGDGYKPADFRDFDLPSADRGGCSEPGYENSWISDSSRAPAGYYRDPGGFVSLTGVITKCGDGASQEPIFTLPEGYRVRQQRPYGLVGVAMWRTAGGGIPSLLLPGGDAYLASLSARPEDPFNQGTNGDWLRIDSVRYRCDPTLAGARENGCPPYPEK